MYILILESTNFATGSTSQRGVVGKGAVPVEFETTFDAKVYLGKEGYNVNGQQSYAKCEPFMLSYITHCIAVRSRHAKDVAPLLRQAFSPLP